MYPTWRHSVVFLILDLCLDSLDSGDLVGDSLRSGGVDHLSMRNTISSGRIRLAPSYQITSFWVG